MACIDIHQSIIDQSFVVIMRLFNLNFMFHSQCPTAMLQRKSQRMTGIVEHEPTSK